MSPQWSTKLKPSVRRLLQTSVILLPFGMMTGCVGADPNIGLELAGAVSANDAYCDVAAPISWSKSDTDQTIKEVKTSNRVYQGLCVAPTPAQ